jgi:hypothetical protein
MRTAFHLDAVVDAKRLSGFEESRDDRFAREQSMLKAALLAALRCPQSHPCAGQPGIIDSLQPNGYSVPPEHIGRMLILKVHPFENNAEIFGLV